MTVLVGNQVGTGGTYGRSTDRSRVSRFTVATAGTADTITANVTSSPANVALVVYSAGGVSDGATTLLGYGVVPAGQTGLVSVPLNNSIALTQGQLIWLGLSESGFLLGDDNNLISMENGDDPDDGTPEASFVKVSGQSYRAPIIYLEETAAPRPSITTADDITSEGDTVTFTLANTTEAPVSATLDTVALSNLAFVSEDAQAGTKTYSYTAPLIADNPTATLEISVDSTTVSTQISYENSLPLGLITHAEPDANSIMFGNTFATTDEIEMATPQLISGDAGAATIDWSALDADQGWTKDISNYTTGNSDGVQVWQFQWLNTSDNTAGTFTRTITVGNGGGSVTVGIPVGIRDLYPDVAAVSLVNNDSGRVTMDSRGVLNTTALYSECVVDMDGTQHRVLVKGGGRGVKPFYKVNWQILD